MDELIRDYEIQLVEPGCAPGAGRWGALATLDNDISAVFPYLNAVLPDARYDHENKVLVWTEDTQQYALRSSEIRVAHVEDLAQARSIVSGLLERLNGIWQDRGKITPRFAERKLAPLIDVFKLLPGTNCRKCGYATCMAFAAEIRKHAVGVESCPPLSQPEYIQKREKISQLIS